MMKTLAERIAFLVSQREILAPWVGEFDEFSLKKWLSSELGDWRRLEQWVDGARVIPRQPVLHILSGNTEHAAFQSLVRALLIGCQSWVKVPSEGLPEFEQWAAQLAGVEVSRELPDAWRNPDLAVIYGGAESLDFFRNWLGQGTLRIEHGPRLKIGRAHV